MKPQPSDTDMALEIRERMLNAPDPLAAVTILRDGLVAYFAAKYPSAHVTALTDLPEIEFGVLIESGGTEYRLTIESSAVKPL